MKTTIQHTGIDPSDAAGRAGGRDDGAGGRGGTGDCFVPRPGTSGRRDEVGTPPSRRRGQEGATDDRSCGQSQITARVRSADRAERGDPMRDTAEYITLLVISIVITVAVGRILMMSGQPFLREVFHDEQVTTSVNRLLSVLFHLITIGVLTMISVWSIDVGTQLQNMVVKLGIVLIVLGIAYGVSMLVLIRVRQQRRADEISEEVQLKLSDRGISTQPTTTPPATTTPVQNVAPPNGL